MSFYHVVLFAKIIIIICVTMGKCCANGHGYDLKWFDVFVCLFIEAVSGKNA